MSKPRRLYETKIGRAKRLPAGSWFVWPDVLPRRNKYYQPRVYRALGDGAMSKPYYQDFGVWEIKDDVNSPEAAYDRADTVAQTLNAMNADEQAAAAYVKKIKAERVSGAMARLGETLFGGRNRKRDQ